MWDCNIDWNTSLICVRFFLHQWVNTKVSNVWGRKALGVGLLILVPKRVKEKLHKVEGGVEGTERAKGRGRAGCPHSHMDPATTGPDLRPSSGQTASQREEPSVLNALCAAGSSSQTECTETPRLSLFLRYPSTLFLTQNCNWMKWTGSDVMIRSQ